MSPLEFFASYGLEPSDLLIPHDWSHELDPHHVVSRSLPGDPSRKRELANEVSHAGVPRMGKSMSQGGVGPVGVGLQHEVEALYQFLGELGVGHVPTIPRAELPTQKW